MPQPGNDRREKRTSRSREIQIRRLEEAQMMITVQLCGRICLRIIQLVASLPILSPDCQMDIIPSEVITKASIAALSEVVCKDRQP